MLGGAVAGAAWGLSLIFEPAGVPPPSKPASYELEWIAPEVCPTAELIRERIVELVPEPEGGEGVMFVHAVVEPSASGFVLALDTEFLGSRSSRRVEARRCSDLGESTALVVAIALQPGLEPTTEVVPRPDVHATDERGVEERAGESEPDQRASETRAVEAVESTRSAPWRPRSRAVPTDLLARIAVLLEYGSMPRVGGGNAIAFGVLWPRLRVEIAGAYLWPRRGPASSAGLYQLGSAGARACLRLFANPTEFPLCVGVDAGALRVDSRGITPGRTLYDAWVAPVMGAGVAVRRNRIGFWSMAELGITARGSRILVGDDPVWRTVPVSLRVLAGLELFFGLGRAEHSRG